MPNKKQFLDSEKYRRDRDVLMALLEEDKDYTVKQVDRLIHRFKKKEVK